MAGGWLSDRLGLGEIADAWLDRPAGRASWARSVAVAFLVSLLVAAVSGAGLSFVYSPGGAGAWASVFSSEYLLAGGWLVRSFHMIGAEAAVVSGTLAVFLWVLEGRYRHHRDLSFWCLSLCVALSLVLCITGNPLRWDNRGYFGLMTEANIASELPVIGRMARAMLLGGSMPSNWTLARLFALHALLLPAAVAALLALWARASARAAAREPAGAPTYAEVQLGRDLAVGAFTFALLLALSFVFRAPLEAPADPLASYNARPEWYFQWLYVLRNAVPASVQGLLASSIPGLIGAFLFVLPLADRDASAGLRRRAAYVAVMTLIVLMAGGLSAVGVLADQKNDELRKARVAQAKLDTRAVQIARATGVPPAGALAMMREDPVLKGEEIFRARCASCHKLGDLGPSDGKITAPVLDGWGSEAWVLAVLDDPDAPDLFGNTPYKEKMPSYTRPPRDPQAAASFKPMPKEQLDAIARFLANEARGAAPGHDPDGEKLVKQRCTTCHLFRGDTDDAQGLAPELAGWASLGWTRAQIANPGTDLTYRPVSMSAALEGHMPRSDGDLSPADLDLLTRFVLHRAGKSKFPR